LASLGLAGAGVIHSLRLLHRRKQLNGCEKVRILFVFRTVAFLRCARFSAGATGCGSFLELAPHTGISEVPDLVWWAEWLRRRVDLIEAASRGLVASAPRVAGGVVLTGARNAPVYTDYNESIEPYSSDPRPPPEAAWSEGVEDHTTYGFVSRGALLSVGGEGSKCAAGAVGSS